jgi:uncharacterized membrane protein YqjE
MADIAKTDEKPEVTAPTGALVREAIDEARELVRLEVALAKKEVVEELAELKVGAGLLGAAGVLAIVGVSMLGQAVVLAIAPTGPCALVVGVCFFVLAGVAAFIGRSRLPKKPLVRTRQRLETDMKQLKERVA